MIGSRTRAFVGLLLVGVVACGLTGVEAWPLTGWKLFSEVRHETQVGWSARRIDDAGREEPIDFAVLGRGYTGSLQVMGRFPEMTVSGRDEVCRTWLRALRGRTDESGSAVGVRVYRTVSALGDDNRPFVSGYRLIHECR